MELDLIQQFSSKDRGLSFLAFSPDDRKLISYGGGYRLGLRQLGTLRLRDVESGADLHTFEKCVGTAAFRAGGSHLLSMQESKPGMFKSKRLSFVWWDVETGVELNRQDFPSDDPSSVIGTDGFAFRNAIVYPTARPLEFCVGANRTLAVCDAKSGLVKAGFGPPNYRAYRKDIQGEHPWLYAAVAVAANGKLALWGDEARFHMRLLAGKGRLLEFPKKHKGWVNAAAFSPDNRHALTGAADGVRYWDLETQQPIGNVMQTSEGVLGNLLSDHCPQCIVFTPGGNEAIFGLSRGAQLFDLRTQSPVGKVPIRKSVVCAAFSHDGSKLAIGTENGKVSLWEIPIPDRVRERSSEESSTKDLFSTIASTSSIEAKTRLLQKQVEDRNEQRLRRAGRIGEFYCPQCREQNAQLDENGFRCGSCGANGDIEAMVKLGGTFNFRTGQRV